MAIDPANSLTYYLSVGIEHKDFLGGIRHWNNLKIAFDDGLVWVKDFTAVQIDSVEVKTIPYKEQYYSSGNKLFLLGSRLPDRNIPSVLWTPIERGLKVELPPFNHNYFGLNEKIMVNLVPASEERDTYALLTKLEDLGNYIQTAPAIRLNGLNWAVVGNEQAIVTGSPILPLRGETYWLKYDFLIPAGLELEFPVLADHLNELLNPTRAYWIVWNKDGSYWQLEKQVMKKLSISSFRLTVQH